MPSRLTLAIEASNPSCPGAGIAIGSPRALRGVELLQPGDGRQDDLIAAIDRLCKRLGLAPQDISRVAISTGPGGYTALRIAVAVAKVLCETLRAECIPIPTANAIARRGGAIAAPTPFAVILASKDQTAFATTYRSPSEQNTQGHLIDAASLPQVRALIADPFLPKSILEAAAAANIPIFAPMFDPTAILELSFLTQPIDPLALTPIYPREPEAVTKWRNRTPK